ncbi:hypothetical protein C2E21_3531 [Chlorella sorokiniana]|uniref:Uncharacterized protein n=1 Tax=Chlorella sorokiniana TaxID=3076 RepID=A0A2P6TUV8_CHLSO|nr:hypothetical protein C2E21_3531 [Chlorella sorokiniana]|eukprot:PRW57826.1 hypothetical protein C2E21_3531 [Chlorella sorokiniana]
MASSRPRRERKAPERFGAFNQLSDSEEEAPLRPRPAAKRRRQALDAEDSDASGQEGSADEQMADSRSGSEDEGAESEGEAPPPKRQRGGGGGSKGKGKVAAAAAPSLKPYVPAPPAQPVPRSDFLATMHACPRLMEMFLEKDDGLRSVTLVARDAANLCTALCARGADAAELWRTLAYTAVDGQRYSAVTPVQEALAAVKAAVKADPARWQRITKTAAMKEFRLTDKDLGGMSYTTRRNPIFWNSAPTKMYTRLDCLVAAHKKHGSVQAIQAAATRSRATADKRKATLAGGEEARREEVEAALEAAGLSFKKYQRKKPVKAFVKRGVGTAAGVAAAFKREIDNAAAYAKRQAELLKRLQEEGLSLPWDASYYAILAGTSGQSVDDYVAGLKAAKAAKEARAQREASITAALQREGLSGFLHSVAVSEHIHMGAPSEAEALATCRQRQQEEQAAQERRQRITAWLAEQQMPAFYSYTVPAVRQFERGQCSEEEAQQACRQQQAVEQAQEQRRQEVSQLLEAQGMPADYTGYVPALRSYVQTGAGSQQEMLAAARAQHARDQRRTALVAALTAEGMAIHLASEPAARAFVSTGEGGQEAALAACRERHQQEVQIAARRSEVAARLPPGVTYEAYGYRCPEAAAYVQRGEGSAEVAVAAIVAYRAAQPPLQYGYDDEEEYFSDY